MVTAGAVFHWSMEGQDAPTKIFDRHATLNDTQIINYKTSPDGNWMVLVGIKSEVTPARRPRPCLPARTRRTETRPDPSHTLAPRASPAPAFGLTPRATGRFEHPP